MNLQKIFYQSKLKTHNKKFFTKYKKPTSKKKLNFLIEFNAFSYYHLILSHMVDFFKKKFITNFYAYPGPVLLVYPIENSIKKKLQLFLLKFLSIGTYGVYKSFGVHNFIEFIFDKKTKEKTKFFIEKNTPKSKQSVLNLKINNILIGDLIYDTYLKKFRENYPTINVKSKKFLNFLNEFINLFFLWEKIIKEKKINRVILSHAEYSLGLPARICQSRGGVTYIVESDRLARLDKNFNYRFSCSKNYKREFNRFPNKLKKIFIAKAKLKLENRVKGSVKDIPYMTKSAYGKLNKKPFILKKLITNDNKDNLKILISTHDFVDAPHINGKFVFNDMVEWLEFLVKFSKETNYLWFIKNHPIMNDKWKPYQAYTRGVVDNIIKNSKIILLDSSLPHNYLIKKIGINCVLTVSGQVAHEYAFNKIPVINASTRNIHSSFNFNFHARNIKHYKYLIKNVYKLKKNLNYDEVLPFYFMHYINRDKNWFFQDLESFYKKIADPGENGYHNIDNYKTYREWLKMFSKTNKEKIFLRLKNFIESESIVLRKY